MKNAARLFILMLIPLLTCGFDWGFGSDPCSQAKKIAVTLADSKSDTERSERIAQIVHLCPDGAAGHFIKALNLEQSGNRDGAAAEYRETIKYDPAFYPAHGNLGLIYLEKGMLDEAAG